MTAIEARFYDGKTSQEHRVLVYPDPPGRLRVVGEGIDFTRALAEVRPSQRVGNSRRRLYFPDGSQCETQDNDAIDALFAAAGGEAIGRAIHLWESRLVSVALALAATGVIVWAGVVYGIPRLAEEIAFGLPASTEQSLGRDALQSLDQALLEPTRLAPARQAAMQALFAGMIETIPGAAGYRLELRASRRIGANALALPSGIVVVTDPLVEIAQNDAEIAAVLAHEIGHLRQRHQLRKLLQDSAAVILVIAVTGDISSVVSLGAALPALLLQSKYSRDFEREADRFALDYLSSRGMDGASLGTLLERMEKQKGGEGHLPDYLSGHPATRERAQRSGAAR